MNRLHREFRPERPRLREFAPIALLGLFFVILAPKILARPDPMQVVALILLGGLVGGGLWMLLRLRVPGSPKLRVGPEGMTYVRAGRTQGLGWDDVAAIHILHDPQRELRFLPMAGGPPIVMHRDMVASDGQRFDMLIEEYWEAS